MKPKTLAQEFGDLLRDERQKTSALLMSATASTAAAETALDDLRAALERMAALLDQAEAALDETP